MLYQNILETIGNTPLVKINKINQEYNLDANIYVKLESFNPSGSVKDRAAYYMIKDAMDKGLINEDTIIIENTSGNTGIGLSMIASVFNLKLIIVMPDSMSKERIKMMENYGAEVILTPGALGMQGSLDKVEELKKLYPNHYITNQFSNEANKLAHYMTTGKEIYDDLNGQIDYFISAIGTGGTISGSGKYLKEKNQSIKIIGVEPYNSPLLNGGKSASHKIQGIGANFIPEILDREIYDQIIDIKDEEAFEMMDKLSKKEGLFAGISSGAAMMAAIKLAKETKTKGNIVVILPDSKDRYLSNLL